MILTKLCRDIAILSTSFNTYIAAEPRLNSIELLYHCTHTSWFTNYFGLSIATIPAEYRQTPPPSGAHDLHRRRRDPRCVSAYRVCGSDIICMRLNIILSLLMIDSYSTMFYLPNIWSNSFWSPIQPDRFSTNSRDEITSHYYGHCVFQHWSTRRPPCHYDCKSTECELD